MEELDPLTREPSPFSSYHSLSPQVEPGHTNELGIRVIYQPTSPALFGVIFFHGLGGASHKTWSKNQDPSLFWPQQWLPLESGISSGRILTFGYNASFRSNGPQNTNVTDFAKDLLFGMKFGKDDNMEGLAIGRVRLQYPLSVQFRLIPQGSSRSLYGWFSSQEGWFCRDLYRAN